MLAACATDSSGQTVKTIEAPALPNILDPPMSNDWVSDDINAYIHSTLISICELTFQPVPALAIMWDKSDGQTLNMMLRQGVLFHNGDPLTAFDAAFSLKRASAAPQSEQILGMIESVTVHNDHNFTIHLKNPYASFISNLAHPRAAILPQNHISAVGGEVFAALPIGTGAYVFDYKIASDRISLVRNTDYWGETPYFERITFVVA